MKVTYIFLNPSWIGNSGIPEVFWTLGARVIIPALTLQIPEAEWPGYLGSTGKKIQLKPLLQTSYS